MIVEIPKAPPSKKTGMEIKRSRGNRRVWVGPKASAVAAEKHIHALALAARQEQGEEIIETNDVAVTVQIHLPGESVRVSVEDLGTCPKKGLGRKRDIDGVASTILDALQGVAYDNDRQVLRLLVERVYQA